MHGHRRYATSWVVDIITRMLQAALLLQLRKTVLTNNKCLKATQGNPEHQPFNINCWGQGGEKSGIWSSLAHYPAHSCLVKPT